MPEMFFVIVFGALILKGLDWLAQWIRERRPDARG